MVVTMYYTNQRCSDAIKEFLIANQAVIKEDLIHLSERKKEWLTTISSVYKPDVEDQYEARIKQHIAFVCSQALALPAEYVIVELERIDLDKYLNV